jgi:tRNA pseudouridine38-40 synthase
VAGHVKRSVVAVWVWYRGGPFRGFQVQVEGPTVQGELRRALRSLGVEGAPAPAGRTDSGVHARMQVVSLRAPDSIAPGDLCAQLNRLLPAGAGVCLVKRPNGPFHAQWRSSGKEYRYRFALGEVPPGWAPYAWKTADEPRLAGRALRLERIDELLRFCQGTRDFGAFHEKSSARRLRTLEQAACFEVKPGLFEARLKGDRFGRYQVRYLVGSAVATAAGEIAFDEFAAAVERGASLRGLKAPAHGLALWQVHYPAQDDPFTDEERTAPPGLPDEPPFSSGR